MCSHQGCSKPALVRPLRCKAHNVMFLLTSCQARVGLVEKSYITSVPASTPPSPTPIQTPNLQRPKLVELSLQTIPKMPGPVPVTMGQKSSRQTQVGVHQPYQRSTTVVRNLVFAAILELKARCSHPSERGLDHLTYSST